MKHYKGFDIKTDKLYRFNYTIWYELTPVKRAHTIKECKDYINLIIWARGNIPQ